MSRRGEAGASPRWSETQAGDCVSAMCSNAAWSSSASKRARLGVIRPRAAEASGFPNVAGEAGLSGTGSALCGEPSSLVGKRRSRPFDCDVRWKSAWYCGDWMDLPMTSKGLDNRAPFPSAPSLSILPQTHCPCYLGRLAQQRQLVGKVLGRLQSQCPGRSLMPAPSEETPPKRKVPARRASHCACALQSEA